MMHSGDTPLWSETLDMCTHVFHCTDSKGPDIHVLDEWLPPTKTPSMHHPWRRNVTTSMVGLKTGHIPKNLTQSGKPHKYSWERGGRRLVLFSMLIFIQGSLWHEAATHLWWKVMSRKWLQGSLGRKRSIRALESLLFLFQFICC